MNKPKVLDQHN